MKRNDFFYNNTLNMFCLQLYDIKHTAKDHLKNVRVKSLLPLHGFLLANSRKGSFISTILQTAFVTLCCLAGMRISSMGPPRGIDPTTHYTMSTFSNSQLSLALTSDGERGMGVKWEEALQFNLWPLTNLEALIFRDHGIADGNAEKPIWNGIPDFLPKHY